MSDSEERVAPPEKDATAVEGGGNPTGDATGSKTKAGGKKKKKTHKGLITLGVIVVVIVVAGVGFMAWHSTPSFCNAFCHSPMDYYVASYSSDDQGMGVVVHAEADVSCLDCHDPGLATQVSEGMSWLSDSYPMTEDGTMLADGVELADEEFCTTGGCHDMDQVVEDTWGFADNDEAYNPHSSHQDGTLECDDCHKTHEDSVLMCNECHELNVPDGWEDLNDSEEE